MNTSIEEALETWLRSGVSRMGQIHIDSLWNNPPAFTLRHIEDAGTEEALLEAHHHPESARAIARFDPSGNFRPLGYAPTLRRGWILRLSSLRELRLTLDFFYPACLGLWKHHSEQGLPITPLRETLGRQTGIYRVTQLLQDAGAQNAVRATCWNSPGCLRRILWDLAPGLPLDPLPATKRPADADAAAQREIPLLCREACSVLIAACRSEVKQQLKRTTAR
jgi:sirohydrochlorin cobaltochelatase